MALKEKRSSIGGAATPTPSPSHQSKKARTSRETDNKDGGLLPSSILDDNAVTTDTYEGMLFTECDLPHSPSTVLRASAADCR